MRKETIMKKLTILALMLTGALAFAQKEEAAPKSDPWAGTWKFDAAQSKLHVPPAKEEFVTSEPTGPDHMTVKYTIRGTAADGAAIHESYDGKADGKPYPLIVDGKESAKISYYRDSAYQYSSHSIGADGGAGTGTVTLSSDGKTITVKEHIKGPTGEFDQVVVYHKQ
jgi:hypothetical protein